MAAVLELVVGSYEQVTMGYRVNTDEKVSRSVLFCSCVWSLISKSSLCRTFCSLALNNINWAVPGVDGGNNSNNLCAILWANVGGFQWDDAQCNLSFLIQLIIFQSISLRCQSLHNCVFVTQEWTAKANFTHHAHMASISAVAASEKFVVTGSKDETIQVYDMKKRIEHGALLHHDGEIFGSIPTGGFVKMSKCCWFFFFFFFGGFFFGFTNTFYCVYERYQEFSWEKGYMECQTAQDNVFFML